MGLLTNLQRAYVPNQPILNKIKRWFDEVSAFIDGFFTTQPTFKAGAYVSANTYISQYGFIPPITLVAPGLYECFFSTPLDATTNYIASVSLANLTVADAVLYDIGVQIVDTTRVRIRVYSLADTAAPSAPVPANHDFYIEVKRLPGF